MTVRLTGIAKRNTPIFATLAMLTICSLSQATLAQDPIRIETNQVLVPAIVIDKERYRLVQTDPLNLGRAVTEGNTQLEEDIAEGIVIRDLTAADFQVFDEGKKQAIQNVTYGRSLYWNFHDNIGYHTEFIGEGGGIWSDTEWPPGMVGSVMPPSYLIAYARPESPEGSCHQIKVKVNRRNALVFARREYCNNKNSASYTSNGIKLVKQMQSDLASAIDSKIDITVTAVTFYTDSELARVHVAIDWPWNSLNRKSMTIGLLGMLFKKNGSLVARFTDLIEADFARGDYEFIGRGTWAPPTRYETQLTLPPGAYDLRAVVSDGTKFGRAEMPLTVDTYDAKKLAISAVGLCKRIQDVSAFTSQAQPKLLGNWKDKLPGDYRRLVSQETEFKPTGDTRFKKDETLYTYFEVYEPLLAAEPSTNVEIRVRIVDLKTGEVRSDSPPVSAAPYVKPGSPVIPIGRKTNISNLPKGSYRLDVQATDSAGKTTPWRSVNFTVE